MRDEQMSKFVNLIAFIDGTGNNAFKQKADEQTNVARLWHACREVKPSGDVAYQKVFYRPGVGTRRWELIRGSAIGHRLMDRVREVKSDLENEIKIAKEDGFIPRIYLFGFSRGAYAVRWLAGLLQCEVEVLGCWDTVKATMKGPDVAEAGKNVKHAFHAMAIDEYRALFDVTHFTNSPQAIEVWFPGCHSDVGGGYKEAELSYAPLNWMVRLSVRCGLLVDLGKIPEEPAYATMPVVHDETRKFGWKIISFNIFDHYSNRQISSAETVYSSVEQLRALGYAHEYLPQNCLAWNESQWIGNLA